MPKTFQESHLEKFNPSREYMTVLMTFFSCLQRNKQPRDVSQSQQAFSQALLNVIRLS